MSPPPRARNSLDELAGIPFITDFPENETAVNAVAGRGDNANPALRGLGAGNTLVILNGRRMPTQPFTAGAISPVNVNVLPSAGVSAAPRARRTAPARPA